MVLHIPQEELITGSPLVKPNMLYLIIKDHNLVPDLQYQYGPK